MDFINKDDKEIIKSMNESLGTQYRTTLYDFNNPDDVIEAVKMATAEYCDLAYYWSTLNSIEESFDESIEVFSPARWANIGLKGTTNNKILDNTIKSLGKTTDLFNDLLGIAEDKCIEVWKIAFNHPSDKIIIHYFGSNKRYNVEKINSALKNLFELFGEIEYDGVIKTSAERFAVVLKNALENNI